MKPVSRKPAGQDFIALDKQNFERKIVIIFLPISFYHMFWVLKRTVSLRRFFWVPTTYVLVYK